MTEPNWQTCPLDPGILREPSPDKARLVIWLPPARDDAAQLWERVSSVPSAPTNVDPGVLASPAVAVRARRKGGGLFGKLLQRFRAADGQPWVLPDGANAEQVGARQTDLLLVWSEGNGAPLDENTLQAHWPQSTRRQRLGDNLFLIGGVAPPAPEGAAASQAAVSPTAVRQPTSTPAPVPPAASVPSGHPRQQAEQLLAEARHKGDRRREAIALVDLGAVCQRTGDPRSAAGYLEEALALVPQLNDPALKSEVLGNLALAVLLLGQRERALQLVEEALASARASDNQFQLKAALDMVGNAYAGLRDPVRALVAFEEALKLARSLGDRPHQGDLLWCTAIQYADLGEREAALASAQAALDLHRQLGNPHAEMLKSHLETYAAGEANSRLNAAPAAGAGGVVVSGWAPAPGGPGPLRMAFSALKSMAKFIGSGMKRVSPAVRDQRLAVCAACEHHTGIRCRLCGCFTSVKTWLPHERCPIEKWGPG